MDTVGDSRGDPGERDARRREVARRYREAHRDRLAAQNKQWRAEHPERSRELNRLSERRRTERRRNEERRRTSARDRARRRRAEDPDGVRAYRRRWKEANPGKELGYQRRYYARHRETVLARAAAYRDRNPDAVRQRRADWARRHPDYAAAYQRAYRTDPERYAKTLQSNRDAKRVERRLCAAGLPPKRIVRSTAADRRANKAAADRFFAPSPNIRDHYRRLEAFEAALNATVWTDQEGRRPRAQAVVAARSRAGLPALEREELVCAWAARHLQDTDRGFAELSPEEVVRAIRSVRGDHSRRRRAQQQAQVTRTVAAYVRDRVPTLSREVQFENRARLFAGKTPLPADVLAHRFAFDDLRGDLDLTALTPADVNAAINRAREQHPTLFDNHPTPVIVPPGVGHAIAR